LPLQDLVEAGGDTAFKVFYIDDVTASRRWRSERSRWYFRPDEAPKSTLKYWSDSAGTVTIEIVDSNDAVVRRLSSKAIKGMNSFDWDLLVDEELALVAETAGLEKAKESNPESKEEKAVSLAETPYSESVSLAETPYSESVRLGHTLYAIPGDYTVRIELGKNSDSTGLKIKAPKDYEPRSSQAYKLRGKK
jgi:hypothetical protein